MAIKEYATQGTAGAFAVIGILLISMAYIDYSSITSDLDELDDVTDPIYITQDQVYVGQEIIFYVDPALRSERMGVTYFMWDFHDGDSIYVTTPDEPDLAHIFKIPGEFTVSVMALRGNKSKIFTLDVSVISAPQDIIINVSSSIVLEDEFITFEGTSGNSYLPIVNYLWEFGDGKTDFGQITNHSYTEEGNYTVKVSGYTANSLIYSGFKEIQVLNAIPDVRIEASAITVEEDELVTFTSSVSDGASDMGMLRYVWSFGDGLMDLGENVTHSYEISGIYPVNLTVFDNNGASDSSTILITVTNQKPVITDLWNYRDYYTEAETITTFSVADDNPSDIPFLSYEWNVTGSGSEVSMPFFDNGSYTIDLKITDDDRDFDNSTTDPFEVINVNPYASLLSAHSSYNVTFRSWGTINSTANITLFKNGISATNLTLLTLDELRNTSRPGLTIENLNQPLNEYWDILIDTNGSVEPYDTYVETVFSFSDNDIDPISIINHCSSVTTYCVSKSFRFPVAPINRGFPITYNFSVFDPGNDNITVFLNLGTNQYSKFLQKTGYGPTSGTVAITGFLPQGELPNTISYFITDMDGGKSKTYSLPLIDYSKLTKPDDFTNKTNWQYAGHLITHYAPIADWNIGYEYNVGTPYSFILEPYHPDTGSLLYTWHFGTGDMSTMRFPAYQYEFEGSFLIWTLVHDDYYQYVAHRWINVTNPLPEYYPIIQGVQTEGNELTFLVTDSTNESNVLLYHWDFGDGATGYGSGFKHKYTQPGNYTVLLTTVTRYNFRDTTEFNITIFNAPPFSNELLKSSLKVSEGNNVIYLPVIQDSPYDIPNLEYHWDINGVEINQQSIWIKTATPTNFGSLIVFDSMGANFTFDFTFNITANPLELAVPKNHYLYGDTATPMNIVGTISPSIFEKDDYKNEYSVEYQLYDKNGDTLEQGSGEFYEDFNGFSLPVSLNKIGNNDTMEYLRNTILEPEDLTYNNSPSGSYILDVRLLDTNDNVIISTTTTIAITIDKDGDFMTDELEIMYSNTIDYLYFATDDTDSDDDGQADPVEYILGEDKDGDGLPEFYEEIYGTTDDNPDTDGDGLTDGYGAFGELTYRANGTMVDTDSDGITDYDEVVGWQIELITPRGLVIEHVTSSPVSGDTDGDGIADYYEYVFKINPKKADTDEDGLSDKREQDIGTSMLNADSDFDGLSDYDEVNDAITTTYYNVDGVAITQSYYLNPNTNDSDEDGLSDTDELYVYQSIGTNKDSDRDGLLDYDELFTFKTDIMSADTDGDGLADGIEVEGFVIPVVIIYGGVYDENGTILTAPRVRNYTVEVFTDPLNMDTDGDGLTDGEEILGNKSDVSDPTSYDSDRDGILDLFDSQKLVSDFAPANITTDIDVVYSIRPGTTTTVVVKTLSTSLSTLWNLIKNNYGSIVSDLIDDFWYWKKIGCIAGKCAKVPRLRSMSSIKSNVKNTLLNFARNHISLVFTASNQYNRHLRDTLRFSGFSLSIKKNKAGIPTGFTISGSLKMTVKNILTAITSIVDPMVNFQFLIEDEAGIKGIKLYQDGNYIKSINARNRKQYFLNENFMVNKDSFTLETTTIRMEIYDINRNLRIIERTTSLQEFSLGILEQGVTTIKETAQSIIKVLKDAWEWVLDGIEYLGNKAADAVDDVIDFVEEVYNKVKDWIKSQFAQIWEGFVRDTLNLLSKGKKYLDKADRAFSWFSHIYSLHRSDVVTAIDDFTQPVIDSITDALEEGADLMENYFPFIDIEALTSDVGLMMDSIMESLDGTVLKYAFDILSGKALKVISDVVTTQIKTIAGNLIGSYSDLLIEASIGIFQQMTAVIPSSLQMDVDMTDGSNEDFLNMFNSILEQLSTPAESISGIISSFNGEYLMTMLDTFILDNNTYLVSLNDIIRTALKPAFALGFAFSDLITLPEDNLKSLLSGDIIPKASFSNEKMLRIENSTDDYWYNLTAKDIYQIGEVVKFISSLLNIAFNEIFRVINAIDLQMDEDVEKESQIIQTIWAIVIYVIQDIVNDVAFGYFKGLRPTNPLEFHLSTDKDSDEFLKTLIFAVFNGIVLALKYIILASIPKLDFFEFITFWAFDPIAWLTNLVDAWWKAFIFGKYVLAPNLVQALLDFDSPDAFIIELLRLSGESLLATPGALISELLNLVASWLNVIYDPLSSILKHGTELPEKLPFPASLVALGIYMLLTGASIYAGLFGTIVEFVVGQVDIIK
ncbi:MAG: PKD domain-containing protein [Candidatus Hodarchaeales archaeon]